MIYITGDTHGDFSRYKDFMKQARLTDKDIMIVLGDAALNYSSDARDVKRKEFVSDFPFTTFAIQGNHDLRPEHVPAYEMVDYHGGAVWREPDFPNIVFAKDGEVYDLDGKSCIVIGGAYSVDKVWRIARGFRWFEDEQPSDEIKVRVEEQLVSRDWKVDVVLSHTAPLKYEPEERFVHGLDQSGVDKSTEQWLDTIEDRLQYQEWYCGHFHTSKKVDKMRFLYKDIHVL